MTEPEKEIRKPIQPFLRKGQGTARFGMANSLRKSVGAPAVNSPLIQLPRFTPTSSIPISARTADSGISNEDETRPPTTSSLPLDRRSVDSPPEDNRRRTPMVVEENEEEEGGNGEDEEVEGVSANQTFFPDSGAESLAQTDSEHSSGARRFRQMAKEMHEKRMRIQTMASVSITPSSYASSDLSGPLGASTPIHAPVTPAAPPPPPEDVPTVIHQPFPSISADSLETPQSSRPFAANRVNVMAQNEAQTGISLIQRRLPNPYQNHQRHSQKENIAAEHVYDQPIQMNVPNRGDWKIRNLMIQLRDAIAHVDFADEQVRTTGRILKEKYQKRKEELEEEFRRRVETIEEENQAEQERLKRERRDVERDRKMVQKEIGDKHKEQATVIKELREKLINAESQLAKLRQDVRSRDEKLKKKDEELEKQSQELKRQTKNSQTMEKKIRQMRAEREKEAKEEQMFVKAAMNRTGPIQRPLLNNQSLTTVQKRKTTTMMAPNRTRSVSWADEPEQTMEVSEEEVSLPDQSIVMTPAERFTGHWGPCTAWRDSLGEMTKVTNTAENGRLFEYSNGDRMWSTAQKSLMWYRHAADGTIQLRLVPADITITYFRGRQLEIRRPNDNITLISLKRAEIRTELMHHENSGYYYTEIFDRDGVMITKDSQEPIKKNYIAGAKYSFREGSSRYVIINTFDDFELVEPEFRLRWYKGETVCAKLFGRDKTGEKTMRMEMDPRNGDGQMESVESRLTNGQARKTMVFRWNGI